MLQSVEGQIKGKEKVCYETILFSNILIFYYFYVFFPNYVLFSGIFLYNFLILSELKIKMLKYIIEVHIRYYIIKISKIYLAKIKIN